jgi:sec-independent protein translocase protein TatA
MSIGGISPGSLLLILLIVLLLFGTKKIKSIGHDLGAAFQAFKNGLNTPVSKNSENKTPQTLTHKPNHKADHD